MCIFEQMEQIKKLYFLVKSIISENCSCMNIKIKMSGTLIILIEIWTHLDFFSGFKSFIKTLPEQIAIYANVFTLNI